MSCSLLVKTETLAKYCSWKSPLQSWPGQLPPKHQQRASKKGCRETDSPGNATSETKTHSQVRRRAVGCPTSISRRFGHSEAAALCALSHTEPTSDSGHFSHDDTVPLTRAVRSEPTNVVCATWRPTYLSSLPHGWVRPSALPAEPWLQTPAARWHTQHCRSGRHWIAVWLRAPSLRWPDGKKETQRICQFSLSVSKRVFLGICLEECPRLVSERGPPHHYGITFF